VTAAHLAGRDYLAGERFTVADAYLAWALLLLKPSGIDAAQWPTLAACRTRMRQRPHVKAAIELEQQSYAKFPAETRPPGAR
jgi:glutathione S-transferase